MARDYFRLALRRIAQRLLGSFLLKETRTDWPLGLEKLVPSDLPQQARLLAGLSERFLTFGQDCTGEVGPDW